MVTPNNILKDALALKPAEKAALIDKLLSSLDKPDAALDAAWAGEAENRCPHCGHSPMGKAGHIMKGQHYKQRWACSRCGQVSTETAAQHASHPCHPRCRPQVPQSTGG